MTRRTVIWSPLVLGARRAWNMLANGVTSAWAAKGAVPNLPPDGERGIILENSNHKLEFDRKNARLLSMRARSAPEQEFAVASSDLPVFVIQYLTSEKRFQQIDSAQAREVNIRTADNTLAADFTGLGGLDLAVTVVVRTRENDASSYWTISVRNHANIAITDVQFPFVVSPYHLGGKPGSEALLQPLMTGRYTRGAWTQRAPDVRTTALATTSMLSTT